MEIIRNKNGDIINRSKNMRGIRYAVGKQRVKKVSIDRMVSGAKLCILFWNGDNYETHFADFDVLLSSVRNWRNLYGVLLTVNGKVTVLDSLR